MYNVCYLSQGLVVFLAALYSLKTALPWLNRPIYHGVQTSACSFLGTRFLLVSHWSSQRIGARGAHHHGLGPLEKVEHLQFSSTDHISAHHDTILILDLTLSRGEGEYHLAARSELELLLHSGGRVVLILERKSVPD